MHMLRIIEKQSPIGSEGWKSVQLEHDIEFSGQETAAEGRIEGQPRTHADDWCQLASMALAWAVSNTAASTVFRPEHQQPVIEGLWEEQVEALQEEEHSTPPKGLHQSA